MNALSLLAINLTRRCNLSCAHCYLDAGTRLDDPGNEISALEVCALLDEIALHSIETMVVLTGGEPLLRRDLETIIQHGSDLGLSMVLGTNGMALTPQRVRSLKQAGLLGAGISVDSIHPERHDKFRGLEGSWHKTMDGIDNCRKQALPFQIHFSVNRDNADEIDDIIEFARIQGARVLNVFFLVCTGRGEAATDITPAQYEHTLVRLIEAQKRNKDLIIRPRCAPHFKRIAYQSDPDAPVNRISGREADACIAGIHYCRITAEGGVTACPYITDEVGSIRRQSFMELWEHAPDFLSLRAPILNGKCGICEFQQLCGGCRARPVALGHALMDEDTSCSYSPRGGAVIQALTDPGDGRILWSEEAERRLSRVPPSLRRLVKKRAEAYTLGLGEQVVTMEHLSELTARRFGGTPSSRP